LEESEASEPAGSNPVLEEFKRYEADLSGILSRFSHARDGIHIDRADAAIFRQYVRELIDLFNDVLGQNSYTSQISHEYADGISNFTGSPSYRSVETILGVVRAAITRFTRNPEKIGWKAGGQSQRVRENIFIIHGRDEAKRRELKEILKAEFHLNPVVLMDQPDAGCSTLVEKFELYARTCSYAIALFTPDDEVSIGGERYLQARPNVLYELGWFCSALGRSGAMLLLKDGTSIFSDFGGIVQKRFSQNIAEKILEIKRDLVAANILD
jgi:predicted nucleotide-binding protein